MLLEFIEKPKPRILGSPFINPGSKCGLLLSKQAGGTGFDFVSTSDMLIMNPNWNPSAESTCGPRLAHGANASVQNWTPDGSALPSRRSCS